MRGVPGRGCPAAVPAQVLGSPLASPAYPDLVRRARDVDGLAEQVLKLCVRQSRDAGHTWQEPGDLLGVTRQATFQRFGKPIDPRTGEPMDTTVRMTDAAERAIAIVTAGLATVTGLVGEFEGYGEGEPFVRRIGDHTVVDIPPNYEAGDIKARVAFDTDEKVAGIFVLAPDTP